MSVCVGQFDSFDTQLHRKGDIMDKHSTVWALIAPGLFACLIANTQAATDSPAVPPAEKHGFLDINGIKIYYEERGKGFPTVLLHGGTSTIEGSFSRQISELAACARTIGIEQVGHGRTQDRDEPFSYDRMVDDTASLLSALDVHQADLIGFSDGGIVAMKLAAKHPSLVRRIVVSGANMRSSEKFREWAQRTSGAELAKKFPAPIRERYERLSPDGPAHWAVVVGKAKDLWATPTILEAADLASVSAPVLVMAGDKDTIPHEQTIEMFRALPKAQLFIVPATGHDTFIDSAAVVNPVLKGFICESAKNH